MIIIIIIMAQKENGIHILTLTLQDEGSDETMGPCIQKEKHCWLFSVQPLGVHHGLVFAVYTLFHLRLGLSPEGFTPIKIPHFPEKVGV
jgi:hypothetical protein